jgi:hypothetical protein
VAIRVRGVHRGPSSRMISTSSLGVHSLKQKGGIDEDEEVSHNRGDVISWNTGGMLVANIDAGGEPAAETS